ncbi:MAG: hypothetical protein WBK55_01340 [Alphaproteobacteria bacterium]
MTDSIPPRYKSGEFNPLPQRVIAMIVCICKSFNDARVREHLSERKNIPAEIDDPDHPFIKEVFSGISGCEDFECGKCPSKILVIVQEDIIERDKQSSVPPQDSPAIHV